MSEPKRPGEKPADAPREGEAAPGRIWSADERHEPAPESAPDAAKERARVQSKAPAEPVSEPPPARPASEPEPEPEPEPQPEPPTKPAPAIEPAPAVEPAMHAAPAATVQLRDDSTGRWLGVLALVLALAAGAGAAYVWFQQRLAETGMDARLLLASQEIATRVDAVREQQAGIGEQQAVAIARLTKLERSGERLEDRLEARLAQVEEAREELRETRRAMEAMRGDAASARRAWIRAEAEYLLQAANASVLLSGSIPSALAALAAADDRLRELDDPGLIPVRERLAAEIQALNASEQPDIQGLVLRLGSLARRIGSLPLEGQSPPGSGTEEATADGEPDAMASALERARSTIVSVLQSMVSIRRSDTEVAPLLAEDQQFLLYRQVELELQIARLAALRGETSSYRESMRAARRSLEDHFDVQDAEVRSVVEALTALEAVEIAPTLPDISGSLRLLRAAATSPAEGV